MTSDLSKVLDYVCVCVRACALWNYQPEHPQFLTTKTTNLTASEPCFLTWKERQAVHSNTGLSLCALNPHTLSFLEQFPHLSVAYSNPPSQSGPSH